MTPLAALTDPRSALASLSSRAVDYLVAARYSAAMRRLLVLCGSFEGELAMSSLDIDVASSDGALSLFSTTTSSSLSLSLWLIANVGWLDWIDEQPQCNDGRRLRLLR